MAIVLLLAVNVAKDPSYLSISYSAYNGALGGNVIDILWAAAPVMMIALALGISVVLGLANGVLVFAVGLQPFISAHLIVLAVGLTFVILIGGIDLSVGAVIAFSSVSGVVLVNAGWNAWLVMVLMILIGAAFGLASGVLIQYFNVQPFIATLAMMFLARGLASMLSTKPERLPEESSFRSLAS